MEENSKNKLFKKVIYNMYSILGNLAWISAIVIVVQSYGSNAKTMTIAILITLGVIIESTKIHLNNKFEINN